MIGKIYIRLFVNVFKNWFSRKLLSSRFWKLLSDILSLYDTFSFHVFRFRSYYRLARPAYVEDKYKVLPVKTQSSRWQLLESLQESLLFFPSLSLPPSPSLSLSFSFKHRGLFTVSVTKQTYRQYEYHDYSFENFFWKNIISQRVSWIVEKFIQLIDSKIFESNST